jgi:thioredoxin reductase (NADPH)
VILATGVIDKLPKISGIENAIVAGTIRLCAVCDGYEARDETIGIYGHADIALRHAEFLRTYSEKVVIIEIGATSANDAALRGRAHEGGIRWLPPDSPLSIVGTACQVRVGNTSVHFDTVYPVLGADPQSELGVNLGAESDQEGNLIVDEEMRTTVVGLYAIGDVVVGLNQISVAVGQAAVAASAVHGILPRNPK